MVKKKYITRKSRNYKKRTSSKRKKCITQKSKNYKKRRLSKRKKYLTRKSRNYKKRRLSKKKNLIKKKEFLQKSLSNKKIKQQYQFGGNFDDVNNFLVTFNEYVIEKIKHLELTLAKTEKKTLINSFFLATHNTLIPGAGILEQSLKDFDPMFALFQLLSALNMPVLLEIDIKLHLSLGRTSYLVCGHNLSHRVTRMAPQAPERQPSINIVYIDNNSINKTIEDFFTTPYALPITEGSSIEKNKWFFTPRSFFFAVWVFLKVIGYPENKIYNQGGGGTNATYDDLCRVFFDNENKNSILKSIIHPNLMLEIHMKRLEVAEKDHKYGRSTYMEYLKGLTQRINNEGRVNPPQEKKPLLFPIGLTIDFGDFRDYSDARNEEVIRDFFDVLEEFTTPTENKIDKDFLLNEKEMPNATKSEWVFIRTNKYKNSSHNGKLPHFYKGNGTSIKQKSITYSKLRTQIEPETDKGLLHEKILKYHVGRKNINYVERTQLEKTQQKTVVKLAILANKAKDYSIGGGKERCNNNNAEFTDYCKFIRLYTDKSSMGKQLKQKLRKNKNKLKSSTYIIIIGICYILNYFISPYREEYKVNMPAFNLGEISETNKNVNLFKNYLKLLKLVSDKEEMYV